MMMILVIFILLSLSKFFFFFFNDTATTEIYTLSLHDALPIYQQHSFTSQQYKTPHKSNENETKEVLADLQHSSQDSDRKSTRLNSSHLVISYAVFCLKKKKSCNSNIFY